MQLLDFRSRVSESLVEFASNEWAQMGVLTEAERASPWATDPEALLLFTLQIARDDARLFDEILDWLALNSMLLSVQRLRNFYDSMVEEALAEAALAWARSNGARVRPAEPRPLFGPADELVFYGSRVPAQTDPLFATFGLVKPPTDRSGRSQRPDPLRPINFAFRLRHTFGVGSRAEIMRFLLTAGVRSPSGSQPLFTTLAVAEAAGFAKRNVHDALNALVDAQIVQVVVRGNERLYRVNADEWSHILGGPIPAYRDWPNALYALAHIHRWLANDQLRDLSPYLLASAARGQMEHLGPVLKAAGLQVWERQAHGDEYWNVFVEAVTGVLDQLASGLAW